MNFAVQLKPADVACGKATLRTSPSSGQATINSLLPHRKQPACHSRAAFEGSEKPSQGHAKDRRKLFQVLIDIS